MQETYNNKTVNTAAALIIITFLAVLVYVGSDILFPLILAFLFAILLKPVVTFFNKKLHLPNILAIALAVFLALGVLIAILIFMSIQVTDFVDDLPLIKKNLQQHLSKIQQWIEQTFGIGYTEQKVYIGDTLSKSGVLSTSSVSTFTSSIFHIVLIPIYTFLILLYKNLLLEFLLKLVPEKDISSLRTILTEIKTVISSYITGLLTELLIVAIMTTAGLWIIGVDYFIFLGIMTAFLNLIPYIGIIIACTITAFIALIGSTNPSIILGVIAVNAVVQFIDNNILIPKIVGSKVSINALTSMIGILIGGALAGIAGMFLAIPMIAILKVIFDRTPSMKPYGYLMGDEIPQYFNWEKIRFPSFKTAKPVAPLPPKKDKKENP